MKSPFIFLCILGTTVISSHSVLAEAPKAVLCTLNPCFETCEQIQEYVRETGEKFYSFANNLFYISAEEQTFENTLLPWFEFSRSYNTLETFAHSDSPMSSIASMAVEELHLFAAQIYENPQFREILIDCGRKFSNDERLNSIEQSIVGTLLQIPPNYSTHKKRTRKQLLHNDTLLCGGRASVSASRDDEGNSSLEGTVDFHGRTEGGTRFSGGVSGEIKRDSDGKVQKRGKADLGIDFQN